jgi:hypothetical protein
VQGTLQLAHAEVLENLGWGDYRNLISLNLSSPNIQYFVNDRQVSLDHIVQFYSRTDFDVYVATEAMFSGERVRMLSIRDGRDELFRPDTIVSADGMGRFSTYTTGGTVATDAGTIVIRHGRLVTPMSIMTPDYATVALNGGRAAVVQITDPPGYDRVTIARGRIQSVDNGRSFRVLSMSFLTGVEYSFTPVQREFRIDHNTIFLTEDGIVDRSTFIDYGDNSVVDSVYNIVIDGTRAAYVVDSPYCTRSVRGMIYEMDENRLRIRNAEWYNAETGRWIAVSNVNATLEIELPVNRLIVKNQTTIGVHGLAVGDQIRVMTNVLPTIAPGAVVTGYMVFVER